VLAQHPLQPKIHNLIHPLNLKNLKLMRPRNLLLLQPLLLLLEDLPLILEALHKLNQEMDRIHLSQEDNQDRAMVGSNIVTTL
jgi:hypothetical protein